MNLFSDPTFSYYATPLPNRLQRVFEHIRKGEYLSAQKELEALHTGLEKVSEYINDEAR